MTPAAFAIAAVVVASYPKPAKSFVATSINCFARWAFQSGHGREVCSRSRTFARCRRSQTAFVIADRMCLYVEMAHWHCA